MVIRNSGNYERYVRYKYIKKCKAFYARKALWGYNRLENVIKNNSDNKHKLYVT